MLVSIVIPVYNRAELVKATLESVRKQTHRPLHLVLVDNNSSDYSLQVLQDFKKENETSDFKIDVVEEKTPGACAARNTGAKHVQSEWLMFFDSDDTMDDCLVAEYVKKINQCNGDVDVITTNVDFNKGGQVTYAYFARKEFLVNHIFHACLSTQRYIVRKSLFEQAGGWNNDVKCWNDWELGIRILLKEPQVAVLDSGIYVHVNVHDESITGACYSQNHERRENAIATAIRAVEKSKFRNKDRIKRLLQARCFVLAGLYKKEGQRELAEAFYAKSVQGIKGDMLLRVTAPIIYNYVSCGGRGIDRLIRLFVM